MGVASVRVLLLSFFTSAAIRQIREGFMVCQRITLGLCFLLLLACGEKPKASPPVPEVAVQVPQHRDVVVEKDFIGEVRAVEEAEIRSKVNGRVVSVEFREGALVRQGQPLFRIDSDSLKAAVDEASAGVAKAKASRLQAETDQARYKALVDKGTISRQQYDESVNQVAQTTAALAAAEAQLSQAQTMLKESAILSPYNGRIGRALVNAGALVAANQTLLATVSTTDAVRVDFSISEQEYLKAVRPRLEADLAPPKLSVRLLLADGSLYPDEGEITFTDRAISADTGTFAVSATFPNPHEVLRPGMYGRVRVKVATLPKAMVIPLRAVQEVLDKTFVSVVDGSDVVVRKPVQLGAQTGADIVVAGGLEDSDRVIVDGHHKARPGSKVKTVPVADTAPANG